MIYLETKRLIVRDHTYDDLESHHKLFTNDEVMYYLQDIQTHSFEESKQNLEEAIRKQNSPNRTMYFLRVEKRDTNEHIGEIGYTVTDFTPVGKVVHLGYFIWKQYWGKGYVTEALKELMRFAFEENNVYRIKTGCLQDNIGSEKVMQKCGMIKEAEFKNSEWHVGQMKTRVEYRLLRDEYFGRIVL